MSGLCAGTGNVMNTALSLKAERWRLDTYCALETPACPVIASIAVRGARK